MNTGFEPFYEEKYVSGDNYHEQIRNACLCVNANRCAVLGGEVQEIKASIDKIDVDESWKDQAGTTFKSNKESCSRILGNMITSIDTLFTQSEQLYNNLLQQLDNLQDLDGQYKELLNNEPKKDEYKKIGEDANGKEVTTYPGYAEAYQEWLGKKQLMEQKYIEMDINIQCLISQLQSINDCTLDASGNIDYSSLPEIIIPDVINMDSPSGFLANLNGDWYVTIDGKNYFVLSQLGYTEDGKSGLLSKLKYIFTETASGYKSSLRAAGCSFCSTFNCVANLLPLDTVLKKLGIDENNKYLANTQSGNDFLVAAINEAVASGYLSENSSLSSYDKFNSSNKTFIFKNGKPEAIEWMVNKYFGDELKVTNYNYKDMTDQEKQQLYNDLQNGNASMIARIGKNDGTFAVGGDGHYMAINKYKKDENGQDMFLVLDSNEEIDERTNNGRVGWAPADEVLDILTYKTPNILVISKKDENEKVKV